MLISGKQEQVKPDGRFLKQRLLTNYQSPKIGGNYLFKNFANC